MTRKEAIAESKKLAKQLGSGWVPRANVADGFYFARAVYGKNWKVAFYPNTVRYIATVKPANNGSVKNRFDGLYAEGSTPKKALRNAIKGAKKKVKDAYAMIALYEIPWKW